MKAFARFAGRFNPYNFPHLRFRHWGNGAKTVWQAVGLTTRQTGFMSGMLWSGWHCLKPACYIENRIHDEMAQVILGNPDQFKAK